ncbi:uncharacterized protein LOC126266252 [Aethina tumida]|uniref:uncharacterized protein LOC126266252 n=1 Tax=Aethina tumida TaxID=116153 RepID=UPI0021489474|nr:uncharacterized protein LOC126266252 [Aethina tumida]
MAIKLLLCVFCSCVALSQQFIIVKNELGDVLYLQPVLRHKRDTSLSASGQGSTVTGLTAEQSGTIASFGGGDHVIEAGGIGHKTLGGPVSLGGSLSYNHQPSNTQLKISGINTPDWGNDVRAEASHTILSEGGAQLSVSGGASQHLGGLLGNTRPEANIGLNFEYRPLTPDLPPLNADIQTMICRFTTNSNNDNC